jgi:hypothetical protein
MQRFNNLETWYFGSAFEQHLVANTGVEISQYCDDLEAMTHQQRQPERIIEFCEVVKHMEKEKKKIEAA